MDHIWKSVDNQDPYTVAESNASSNSTAFTADAADRILEAASVPKC